MVLHDVHMFLLGGRPGVNNVQGLGLKITLGVACKICWSLWGRLGTETLRGLGASWSKFQYHFRGQ